jgi:hypothetical protein
MAGSSSAAARVPFGRLGDAALLKRFAAAFDLTPRPAIAGREIFDPLYARLPGRFPPLFEQLVTAYAWEQADLGDLELLPNPPGADLAGLTAAIFRDPGRAADLLAAGFLPFAQSQDPVCFDSERRRTDRDCPVVRIGPGGEAEEIAPSFRALIERFTS